MDSLDYHSIERHDKMKKPMNQYEVAYPMNAVSSYYGTCEDSNSGSCIQCNTSSNTAGSGVGSGNTISWGN